MNIDGWILVAKALKLAVITCALLFIVTYVAIA